MAEETPKDPITRLEELVKDFATLVEALEAAAQLMNRAGQAMEEAAEVNRNAASRMLEAAEINLQAASRMQRD